MPKILIVEDDLMIADLIETILVAEGYEVCGIARTVAEAVALCRLHTPTYAIVDLRLADGGVGTEIIGQLGGLNPLSIMYASDNAGGVQLTAAHGVAFLSKPYRPTDLVRALAILIDIVTTGHSTLPHPAGFHLLRPAASSEPVLT